MRSNSADFKTAKIGVKVDSTTNEADLLSLMKENGDNRIEILKIDIEGYITDRSYYNWCKLFVCIVEKFLNTFFHILSQQTVISVSLP